LKATCDISLTQRVCKCPLSLSLGMVAVGFRLAGAGGNVAGVGGHRGEF